jgi:hypothetical protein
LGFDGHVAGAYPVNQKLNNHLDAGNCVVSEIFSASFVK